MKNTFRMALTFDLFRKLFCFLFLFFFVEKVFSFPQIQDPRPLTHFKSNEGLESKKNI